MQRHVLGLALLLRVAAAAAGDGPNATSFAAACRATDFAPVVRLPAARFVVTRDYSRGLDAVPRGHPVGCAVRRLLRLNATQRCARWDVGKYDERRAGMYTTSLFENDTNAIDGYAGVRDVHIGLDVGGPVGTPVYAPADGVVHAFGYNEAPGDYGHVVVTEHAVGGHRVWMLFGHLDASTPAFKRVGARVRRGDRVGAFGDVHENGGWPPHLHFQLSLVEPSTHDMPGVVSVAQRDQALRDYPDPRLVAGMLYRDDDE